MTLDQDEIFQRGVEMLEAEATADMLLMTHPFTAPPELKRLKRLKRQKSNRLKLYW